MKTEKIHFFDTVPGAALLAVGLNLLFLIINAILCMPLLSRDSLKPEHMTLLIYALFISYWIITTILIQIIPGDRFILKKIGPGRGNTGKNFFLGLLFGFLMNGFCIAVAAIRGDVFFTKGNAGVVFLLIAFVCVLIQSAAEEYVNRVYLYQRLKRGYPDKPWVPVLFTAIFFSLAHMGNQGMTWVTYTMIFLIGIFFALVIHFFDSAWMVFGLHTVWNYSQSIIFGLPNSGIVLPCSFLKLEASVAEKTVAYDPVFGIEGTYLAVAVAALAIVVTLYIGNKKSHKFE